jgi:multidrug transporter EmrE-like cation transporter
MTPFAARDLRRLMAMPLLGVANQYCAMRAAAALPHRAPSLAWLLRALALPAVWAWIGFELVALFVWTALLAELELSAAFPMTAAGYVLVVALGWTAFHEPLTAPQVVGAAAILAGVRLLAAR